MKNFLKIVAVIIFIVIIGIQFFRPERVNPPINEQETLEANSRIPEDIQGILKNSCNDCHSNKTDFPWYSNVAPVSWSVVEHIEHGREELNFSKWGTYSQDRKLRKLEEICDEVKAREMPHNQYLWVHWDAKLSDEQINDLCKWTDEESKRLES